MGLLNFLKRQDSTSEIKQAGIDISDCDFDCGTCENQFPASLKLRSDDDGEKLWKSTKEYDIHVLVSTGKADWQHDATDTKGLLEKAVSEWQGCKELAHKPKITCSSFPPNSGEILILPFFVWLKGVSPENATQALDKVVPQLVSCRDQGIRMEETGDLFGDGLAVKVEIDNMDAYVFLCSHRTRDKRCGVTAPIMKKEFELHIRDDGKYRDVGDTSPNGIVVGFINHVGGHKYAANVLVYRRQGELIWLARATPSNVKPIYEECIKHGKTFAGNTRFVEKSKAIAW